MEMIDAIATSLIRTVHSVENDWQPVVQIQTGTENKLRSFAEDPSVNTKDFCSSLLSCDYELSDAVFQCALSKDSRASITDLLDRRKEARTRKEECITLRDFEKAAMCLNTQQELTAQIIDFLDERKITITAQCVKTAIDQMGWVENKS